MLLNFCTKNEVSRFKFEIWTIVWRKLKWRHYDVIPNLIFMNFFYTNLQRAYQSSIPDFKLDKHTRAEIYSREVNRESWKIKKINFEPLWHWPFVKVKKAEVIRCRLLYYFTRYHHLFILCDLWPSPVTFIVCQGHFHFNHYMHFMLLNVCTNNEVCGFSRIWNMDICI